jgi:hypothetical protein
MRKHLAKRRKKNKEIMISPREKQKSVSKYAEYRKITT